jgi:hypothetical protein
MDRVEAYEHQLTKHLFDVSRVISHIVAWWMSDPACNRRLLAADVDGEGLDHLWTKAEGGRLREVRTLFMPAASYQATAFLMG